MKMVLLVASLVVLALLISGCGGGDPTPGPKPGPTLAPSPGQTTPGFTSGPTPGPTLAPTQADLVSQGIAAFRAADVNTSARLFDAALAAGQASSNYFWQRGITLYYVDRFKEGSGQFRTDVAHGGGGDTEESIWAFVCDAPALGFDEARKQMVAIEGETRPYMKTLYSLFRGDGSVSVKDVEEKTTEGLASDAFYYKLYLGLFEEAMGHIEKARTWITKAAASDYASGGDYMGDVAVVHAKVRGWLSNSSTLV